MVEIGGKYKCEKSFLSEETLFEKNKEYVLIDLVEEESFTLYIFNNSHLFGDFDNDFNNHFISIDRERIRNLQKVVFG